MKRLLTLTLMVLFFLTTAGPLPADDLELFGGSASTIPANVLIILDTSDSMNEMLNVTTPESPDTKVSISKFNLAKMVLAGIDKNGQRIKDASGNDLPGIIDLYDNVNLGLMAFHPMDGGYIVAKCGESVEELRNKIKNLGTNLLTPLAETLAEAGLYFAGKRSWFNSPRDYAEDSPISADLPCQKNKIIILTDGKPTADGNKMLANNEYILEGQKVFDYDKDGKDETKALENLTGEFYYYDNLDDVARFLYVNDIAPDVGTGDPDYEKQNIVTHVVAFSMGETPQVLKDTVAASDGEGILKEANDYDELLIALKDLTAGKPEGVGMYVAPVVPVSQSNRAYAGDKIYLPFFKVRADGRWFGNLKKYGIDEEGDLVDADGENATDSNGFILDSARSFWTATGTNDGNDVLAGGIGGVLKTNLGNRKIYTYVNWLETAPVDDLAYSSNAFATGNGAITASILEVADDQRDVLIKDIIGTEPYVKESDEEAREWFLGDIVHSQPIVVTFDTNDTEGIDSGDDTYIFVGSNDGMMHCFGDATGAEEWAFIPPEFLPRLNSFIDESPEHQYFVDGASKVLDVDGKRILFFGLRRGGTSYHALDVTVPTSPKYLYEVTKDALGEGKALGQSWGIPKLGTIATGKTNGQVLTKRVAFLPGGYDTEEDKDSPGTNSVGRAVFAIDASDGTPLSNFSFAYDESTNENSDMQHSIVDLTAVDTVGDGLINRVYAPDLGGNIFAFEDDNSDGQWEMRHLFSATDLEEEKERKIFAAPDVVTILLPRDEEGSIKIGDMIFFGTGDQEDLDGKGVRNGFFAVKNDWSENTDDLPLDESDLYDATENRIQEPNDLNDKIAQQNSLDASKGWYIKLEDNTGEKVISSPTVYNGVVYFTTFVPEPDTGDDEDNGLTCTTTTSSGTTYLYVLNARNGAAVLNFSEENDENGIKLGVPDRRKKIADTITSPATITIRDNGPEIDFIVPPGPGNGDDGDIPPIQFRKEDTVKRPEVHMHYWREMRDGDEYVDDGE